MAKPTLYGISSSRAFRSIWAIEEIGIDYDHVPTSFTEESKSPEYLAVNPNGRIPALVDDGVSLFESMAINLYLAKKYSADLYPSSALDEAATWQWSVWGISEIEPLQMQIVVQKFFMPEDKKDEAAVGRAERGLARPLKVLDDTLANSDYLLGADFSVADLNLAGVMELLNMIQFDMGSRPNVQRWLAACRERPSYGRAKAV